MPIFCEYVRILIDNGVNRGHTGLRALMSSHSSFDTSALKVAYGIPSENGPFLVE
jgi:hypothetical protein